MGLDGCEVIAEPEFVPKEKSWLLRVRLSIQSSSELVPSTTAWAVLAHEGYPLGPIGIYPAEEGGIAATFPHQERNMSGTPEKPWRTGKICVDSVYRDLGVRFERLDPVGEAESRLLWYISRALLWLYAAAKGELVLAGEPFELPQYPAGGSRRIVHDEGPDVYGLWQARGDSAGYVALDGLSYRQDTFAVVAFSSFGGEKIRDSRWSSVELNRARNEEKRTGVWWRWPAPIVVKPWHVPATWGELRQTGKETGIDVDSRLSRIANHVRGNKCDVLLLGYPIPLRQGGEPSEMYWHAIEFPILKKTERQPHGFRNNDYYWWRKERDTVFRDDAKIVYSPTENWHPDRLQSRGRLLPSLRNLKALFIGVGALGSVVAELMTRGGMEKSTLLDKDGLQACNIVRHVLTLKEIDSDKVKGLANRLRLVNPYACIDTVSASFPRSATEVQALLEPFDLIVECTGSDEVLEAMGLGWWPTPKLFCSASLGLFGKRLFVFISDGNCFRVDRMKQGMEPWAESEGQALASEGETLEGAGCWSPLFPARLDDITMAAATAVKVIEQASGGRSIRSELVVYEQAVQGGIFEGFKRVGS
jgi:hypothetical protein